MYDDQLKNAYFAGLIDGEGNLDVYPRGSGMRPKINVNMTCEKTVKALHQYFGGCFGIKKVKEGLKPQWYWFSSSTQALEIIRAIRPYLITKASNADRVLNTTYRKAGRPKKAPL